MLFPRTVSLEFPTVVSSESPAWNSVLLPICISLVAPTTSSNLSAKVYSFELA